MLCRGSIAKLGASRDAPHRCIRGRRVRKGFIALKQLWGQSL